MDRLTDLTRVLEHDGPRMRDLTGEIKTNVVDLSYRVAARLVAAVSPQAGDPEATAVIVLGALVALRRTTWTFGSPPIDMTDRRVLTAWVDVTLAALGGAWDREGSMDASC
jgi:hypothetical protein